jgi:hypothetical protein
MSRLLVSCRFAPYCADDRLLSRSSLPVVESDGIVYESFGPDCWLAGGQNAEVQFGHDTEAIGSVVVVAAASDGWWHPDVTVETDDTKVLEHCRPGTPVSVGARLLRRFTYEDLDLRLRRHGLAQLQHIAIGRRGEHPGYQGAKITSVQRLRDEQPATVGREQAETVVHHRGELLVRHGVGQILGLR